MQLPISQYPNPLRNYPTIISAAEVRKLPFRAILAGHDLLGLRERRDPTDCTQARLIWWHSNLLQHISPVNSQRRHVYCSR